MQTLVTDPATQRRGPGQRQESSALAMHAEPAAAAREPSMRNVQQRADALGWFSIGLGLSQVLAPGAMSRLIGVRDREQNRHAMLAIGLREITAGIGILSQREPKAWLWARVAGDAMDLALLGRAFASPRSERNNLTMATAAVAGVLALDWLTARDLDRANPRRAAIAQEKKRVKMTETVTLNRPLEDVTRAWREYEEAHHTNISVEFAAAPAGRGTEIRAQHGALRGPMVLNELRHFKQIVETGEVVHSDASIHRGPHPAQPSPIQNGKQVSR